METGRLSPALLLSTTDELAAIVQQDEASMEHSAIFCTIPARQVQFIAENHGGIKFRQGLAQSNLGFSLLMLAIQMGDEQHRLLIPLVGGTIKRTLLELREKSAPLQLMFGDLSASKVARYKANLRGSLDAALAAHVEDVGVRSAFVKGELLRLGLVNLSTTACLPAGHNDRRFFVRASVLIPPEHR